MDEPTAALGPSETAMVAELVGQLQSEGIGIFLVSHDLHDVFDPCDRIMVMNKGRSVFAHRSTFSTFVLVSVVKDDITFADAELHKREASIVGSRNALRADFERVVAALTDGTIDTGALLSETLSLDDLPTRFPALAADREGSIKAVVTL